MDVRFYIPESLLPSAEKRAAWEAGEKITLEQAGNAATAQAWIFRTWVTLAKYGCRTELVHRLPETGAVIACAGAIPRPWPAAPGLFLVDVVADSLPHKDGILHIVQNAAHAARLPWSVFIPHWPQPDLVPRAKERGAKFERVAFFGDDRNLAIELRDHAWQAELQRTTGASFEIRRTERWHDYSDVDAVVAVRDFGGMRQLHKPATKLYNAWIAGVPFIGGADSAYAADGKPGRDYLVARTPSEVLRHLAELSRSPEQRGALAAAGRNKAENFSEEAMARRWRQLVEETIPQRMRRRQSAPVWARRCEDFVRRRIHAIDRIFRS